MHHVNPLPALTRREMIGRIGAGFGTLGLAGVVDANHGSGEFIDLPVVDTPKDLGVLDTLIITDLSAPQEAYDLTAKVFPPDRVLAPKMLNISFGIRPEEG